MKHRIVTIQFSRAGERENVDLDPNLAYRVRIDGGPPEEFRSPWTQDQLDDCVEVLRNKGDSRPTAELIMDLGKQIGCWEIPIHVKARHAAEQGHLEKDGGTLVLENLC